MIHALDMAFDKHGEISKDGSDCHAVVAISGWALTTFKGFFFDETDDFDWSLRLEQTVPIVALDRVKAIPGYPEIISNFTGKQFYHYHTGSITSIQRRRELILGELFKRPSKIKMEGFYRLQSHLAGMAASNNHLIPRKYIVVHSRSLEGSCEVRLGERISHDECTMEPSYIKRLLQKLGWFGQVPIVVITDMQSSGVIENLKNDFEIGNEIVVPSFDIKGLRQETHPATDMMIAVMSDAFVGTRISSMAKIIGLVRTLIGKEPQTNLLYMDKELNVCEQCIYYCNATAVPVCGDRPVFS